MKELMLLFSIYCPQSSTNFRQRLSDQFACFQNVLSSASVLVLHFLPRRSDNFGSRWVLRLGCKVDEGFLKTHCLGNQCSGHKAIVVKRQNTFALLLPFVLFSGSVQSGHLQTPPPQVHYRPLVPSSGSVE